MAHKHDEIVAHLNICLEWIQSGQETIESALAHFPAEVDELRPMLEAAFWMLDQSQVFAPDPQRLRLSKRRLVSRIKQEIAAPQPTGLQAWFESLFHHKAFVLRAAISLILVLTLTFGSIGVAQASQSTIPGDGLYGVKLTLEDAELAFSLSPAQSVRLHIKFIRRRVIEIQTLVLDNRLEFLNQAVTLYQKQIDQALANLKEATQRFPLQSIQLATELQDTLANQAPLFAVLAETVPTNFRSELTRLQAATDNGISASNEVIHTANETPTPIVNSSKVSATLPPSQISSPVSSLTPAANFTPTPLASDSQPLLPAQEVSATPPSTPTPTQPLITDGEDDDAIPTKKPTKTPKPTKVPKPTKTPKIKIKD